MEKFVITVNRQFGSYGRVIARKMSEILNIPCYDSELIEEVAEELDMTTNEIEKGEEKAVPFTENNFNTFFTLGKKSTEKQDKIFEAQKKYILDVVKNGSCIVVGRCSDYILLEEKNALHIYIFATYEARLKYCKDVLKLEEREAVRVLREVDILRDSYQLQYAGYLSDEKEHKDIIIDSNTLGIDETAKLLAEAAKFKFSLN